MKKPYKMIKRCSGLLALLLLAGCTSVETGTGQGRPASSVAPSAVVEASSSLPAASQTMQGQKWQQYMYTEAAKAMQKSTSQNRVGNISLWRDKATGEGLVLILQFVDENLNYSWETGDLILYMQDGQIHEIQGYYSDSNPQNGNIRTVEYDNEKTYVYEWEAGEKNLLYTMVYNNDGTTTYTGGGSEFTTTYGEENPMTELFGSIRGTSAYANIEMMPYQNPEFTLEMQLQRLGEFLGVHPYVPQVPAGAPDWVAEYVKYYHNRLYIPYMPEKTVASSSLPLFFEIQPPPFEGGAPVLVGEELAENSIGVDGRFWFYDKTVQELLNNLDGGCRIYQDDTGRAILLESNYGYSWWSSMDNKGITDLFMDAYATNEPENFVRIDDEIVYIEEGQQFDTDAWLKEKRTEKFARLGYNYASFTPVQGKTVTWPENLSWEELEAAMIEKLCSYAKEIGQMK